MEDKWRSFGWNAMKVDGHDVESLLDAFTVVGKNQKEPSVIICNTKKGKGVSFMENNIKWHCNTISKELRNKAIEEIETNIN